MKTKKNSSKRLKSDSIFLPLDLYESIMQEVQDYQELQERENVRWVKVRVDSTAKKVKSTKKS